MSGDFKLGDWTFTPATGLIRRADETLRLGPQQAELLRYLIERAGRVVSKDEVLDNVWSGTIVEEAAVHRCISELRKALGDNARSPAYIRTVPKRGYQWVSPVSRLPTHRPDETTRPAGPSLRTLVVIVVIAGLCWWLYSWRSSRTIYEQPETAGDRPSLAVLEFDNARKGAGSDWLATAVPEMLSTEMARATDIHVIPSDAVARSQLEVSVRAVAEVTPPIFGLAKSRLGADYVVVGTVAALGAEVDDSLRIDVRVVRTAGGEVLGSLAETGTIADLFDLVERVAVRVLELLGSRSVAGRGELALTPYLPRNSAAIRLYFAGLRRLRQYDPSAARELLEQALQLEADQPWALLALSQAHFEMGDRARAAEVATQALALSKDLPREHRLWFEANRLVASSQWNEAIVRYQALRLFSPRNQEYALLLASAQNRAGRHEEAFATATGLRTEGAEDPRIDILLAESAALQGEHQQALESAKAAEELSVKIGATRVANKARLLQAEASYRLGSVEDAFALLARSRESVTVAGDRRSEAHLLQTLASWQEDVGEFAESRANLLEALVIFQALGDRTGEAEVLTLQAFQAHDDGETDRGDGLFEAALEIFGETGNRRGEADLLQRRATALAFASDFRTAAVHYESALELYRELGNRELESMMLMNLGRVHLFSGETSRAEGRLMAADEILRDLDAPGRSALVRYNLGFLHFENGNLPEARAAFTEAERIFDEIGNDRMRATSLEFVGVVLAGQGDLFRARVRQGQALAMRREMGSAPRLVKSLCFSSDLALEDGDPSTAEELAREAIATSGGDTRSEVESLMLLAHILSTKGELTEAQATLERAKTLHGEPDPLHDEAQQFLLIEARLHKARGEFDEASGLADRVLSLSQAGGSWATHAGALLLSGEIDLARGNRMEGEATLRRLAEQAADRGWTLFERKANAALSVPDAS